MLLLVLAGAAAGSEAAHAEKRAFVVGISKYDNIQQSLNSTNDARMIEQKLGLYGYKNNTTYIDEAHADTNGFTKAWSAFLATVKPGDDIIVYFSGHGFSYQGNNYIALRNVPGDASHDDAINYAKNVSTLANQLNNRFVNIGLFILEACRDDPFGYKDHSIKKGTTIVNRLETSTHATAIVVWYAASEGETSLAAGYGDNKNTNSLFTNTLANSMEKYKTIDIERFAKEIRLPVLDGSPPDHPQHPWLASNLTFDWCFGACPRSDINPTLTSYAIAKATPVIAASSVTISRFPPAVAEGTPVVRQVSVSPNNYQDYLTQSRLNGNAMFLGKKSALQNCRPGENDDRPFGCEVLGQLVNGGDPNTSQISAQLLERPLKLETATYLHLTLPTALSSEAHAKDA